jgi:ribonuclease HI
VREASTTGLTVVYTDGACLGNPGPGGWAWATGEDRYRSGHEEQTTNQRMEVTAALRALEVLAGPVQVVSDSTYVVNCFRDKWWQGWRRRGWRNAQGKDVANQDLWKPLIEIVVDARPDEIEFRWVKGHSNTAGNDLVDRLANEAARLQRVASAG